MPELLNAGLKLALAEETGLTLDVAHVNNEGGTQIRVSLPETGDALLQVPLPLLTHEGDIKQFVPEHVHADSPTLIKRLALLRLVQGLSLESITHLFNDTPDLRTVAEAHVLPGTMEQRVGAHPHLDTLLDETQLHIVAAVFAISGATVERLLRQLTPSS